jgi:hypothetical protein
MEGGVVGQVETREDLPEGDRVEPADQGILDHVLLIVPAGEVVAEGGRVQRGGRKRKQQGDAKIGFHHEAGALLSGG